MIASFFFIASTETQTGYTGIRQPALRTHNSPAPVFRPDTSFAIDNRSNRSRPSPNPRVIEWLARNERDLAKDYRAEQGWGFHPEPSGSFLNWVEVTK